MTQILSLVHWSKCNSFCCVGKRSWQTALIKSVIDALSQYHGNFQGLRVFL